MYIILQKERENHSKTISQKLMWASMGFFENFQLPKMQFPPASQASPL